MRGLYDLEGVHQLRNLPASKQEVIDADKALGGPGSVTLLGPNATVAALEAEPLGDFSVMHLAVHSIASTEFSNSSCPRARPKSGLGRGRTSSGVADN